MSKAIFKDTVKRSWKLLVTFFIVLTFYLATIISLIDPENMAATSELFGLKEEFMAPFGINIAEFTTPLNYTASTFFSLLVMAFAMVFYVIQAIALIARPVEDCSIVSTLSAPVKRSTLVLTRGTYLICSMTVLFFGILVCGSVMLNSFGDFDFWAYCKLVILTYLLCTALAMLSYFLSVAFCDSKWGIMLPVGVPIAMMFLSMIGGAGGEKTEWVKKITPFSWLDSVGIVTGRVEIGWMLIAFAAAIVFLLFASVVVFDKKRLPI